MAAPFFGKENLTNVLRFSALWLLIFGLGVLIRLPNFLSKNFFFDGDEAVIGIMAQDLLEGKNFPLYFYGQNYGLATFETVCCAFFIKIFGSGIWALKLSGIFLYSFGLALIFRLLKARAVDPKWRIVLLTVFLCAPVWYLPASQMRAASFVLATIVLYLLYTRRIRVGMLVLLSVFLGLLFESQLMMCLFVLPFVASRLLKERRWLIYGTTVVLSSAVVVGMVKLVAMRPGSIHRVKMTFGSGQWENLDRQLDGFFPGFNGFNYFTMDIPCPGWWEKATYLLVGLLCVIVLPALWERGYVRRTVLFFGIASGVFLFLVSLFPSYSPRYFISFHTGMLFLLLFVFLFRRETFWTKRLLVPVALISVAGIFAGSKMKVHFYDAGVNEMETFSGLHDEVKRSGVRAVFSTDVYLQWQWNYLYGEEIPAASFNREERTNEFLSRANKIYRSDPGHTAIVGLWGIFAGMDTLKGFNDYRYQVHTKYFIAPAKNPVWMRYGWKIAQ